MSNKNKSFKDFGSLSCVMFVDKFNFRSILLFKVVLYILMKTFRMIIFFTPLNETSF